MTRQVRENWIVNIENATSFIASEIGNETVGFVLEKYGAETIDEIADCDLSDVFNELDAIEAEIRSD